jgi:phosphatidylserine/phosphatidylglycerophosphate/cardiolipin synthase-like enzyme
MALRNRRTETYPWRQQCRFELLVDGPQFFPVMLQAIEQAARFILLEFYLVESGVITRRFVDALVAARRRGVAVYIIFDAYGSQGLGELERETLLAQEVRLEFFNPVTYRRFFHSLRRDHRKILVVDGMQAFIGGTGLSDEFLPPLEPQQGWHEVMVKAEGPVVDDWIDVFRKTWTRITARPLPLPSFPPLQFQPGQAGRVTIAEGPQMQEISRSFIKHVHGATQRVWLTTPYFVASWKIRRALMKAARRGVDVRLMLPGPLSDQPWVSNAARGFYSRLLKQGVRLFEYQPRFTHGKVELCDDWVSIGSSNLDRWNQHWNMDANQEIQADDFTRQVSGMFLRDFRHCVEINLQQWRQRPRLQRLREWLSGRLVMLLERLTRSHRK